MPVYSPIMLALCSMLLVTYYASNYAGIIGLGLVARPIFSVFLCGGGKKGLVTLP